MTFEAKEERLEPTPIENPLLFQRLEFIFLVVD